MGQKRTKIPMTDKLSIAKRIVAGETTVNAVIATHGYYKISIQFWVELFKAHGDKVFCNKDRNQVYSPETKMKAVLEYLAGEGSLVHVAAKYALRSPEQLRLWIKMYNDGVNFSHKMSGGSRMTASRKTTKEERIKIAKECIENGSNYGEIALKYHVSYQQVYTWVKNYSKLGEAGLEDRRGKRKVDQAPRNEVEELKIKLAQVEHELYMTKMERDLLKKVKELQRTDPYLK